MHLIIKKKVYLSYKEMTHFPSTSALMFEKDVSLFIMCIR